MKPLRVFVAFFSYGGVVEQTYDSMLREMILAGETPDVVIEHHRISGDALISRSRSRQTGYFLKSDCDVLFLVDHDIAFEPGDLLATAREAHRARAIVAGAYAKRGINAGIASRITDEHVLFTARGRAFHPCEYVATGFLAVPRAALSTMVERLTRPDAPADLRLSLCVDEQDGASVPYHDLFRPFSVPSRLKPPFHEYLSEDWAFSARAAHCGVPLYLWEYPQLVHHGMLGFTLRAAERAPLRLVPPAPKTST